MCVLLSVDVFSVNRRVSVWLSHNHTEPKLNAGRTSALLFICSRETLTSLTITSDSRCFGGLLRRRCACVKQGQLSRAYAALSELMRLRSFDLWWEMFELMLRSLDFAISVKPSTVWDSHFFSLNILFHSLNELL